MTQARQATQVVQAPGISRWDMAAAGLAAGNMCDWFMTISPADLAQYVVADTDLSAMLPQTLVIPPMSQIIPILGMIPMAEKAARKAVLVYMRGLLRSPDRAIVYEQIRRQVAARGFREHALVLAWGLPLHPYDTSQIRQETLRWFPALGQISSAQGWYHVNMDRVLVQLIHQLEDGGDTKHDTQCADGVDDSVPGGADSGTGNGVVVGGEGEHDNDLPGAFSVYGFGSG